MIENDLQNLPQWQDADMVLVGIGEDMQYDWSALTEDQRFQEIEKEIGGDEERIWIIPFLQKMVLSQKRSDRWSLAYERLRDVLAEKNYYIVSLCMDDKIFDAGIRKERIVTPCGGFRRMQCDNNCSHVLSEVPEQSCSDVLRYYRKEMPIESLKEPVCPVCGGRLRFNQLGVARYAEEGYLERWNDYMKWLQGTVNRKVFLLELGVGMEYPTVIRFPFEKIAAYNQKAFLCRVHASLCQIGEPAADRGMPVRTDPVDFLCGCAR